LCIELLQSRDRREDPDNQNTADTSENSHVTPTNSNANTSVTIAQVIPVIEENFSISKKMNTDSVKIQKICTTKTERITIPRRFEEVFVNGKKLEAFEKHDSIGDEILSKVKEGIKESLDSIHKDHNKKEYSVSEQNESKRELIPLFDYESSKNQEIEKVIPVYAEEIVVSKQVVKLGEVVIKKNRVTINNKIVVDIQKEKVRVQYPDGIVQRLTESK
jgi:stress response protein YsnF